MIGGYQNSSESFQNSPSSPEIQYFTLKPTSRLSIKTLTDRQLHLLKRFQIIGRTFGRLGKMLKDI